MNFPRDCVILAIAPNARGFGYIVFEEPHIVMDWGNKIIPGNKLRDSLLKANVLMHMLQPGVLIVEDVHHKSSRRCKRVRELVDNLAKMARRRKITVVRCSRESVRKTFDELGARNKDDIAAAVARTFPELAPRLPPRRRTWDPEHYNMAIFEASSFALTVFHREGVRRLFKQ